MSEILDNSEVEEGLERFSLFSYGSTRKNRIISLRIEEELFQLLNSQKEKWNNETVAETMRAILTMHFLPTIYGLHLEQIEEERSGKFMTPSRFEKEMEKTIQLLEEAEERSIKSMEYLKERKAEYEELLEKRIKFEELWKAGKRSRK